MRQADGAFAPSCSVEISADGAQSLIVDVQVTQAANDSEQLTPAVKRIAERMGQKKKKKKKNRPQRRSHGATGSGLRWAVCRKGLHRHRTLHSRSLRL